MMPAKQIEAIPLGWRCHLTGILRDLKERKFRCPFDWAITADLDVVNDCLNTDFKHYLDTRNYEFSKFYVFDNNGKVVNEHLGYCNRYYGPYQENCKDNNLLFIHEDVHEARFQSRCLEFMRLLREGRRLLFIRLEKGLPDGNKVASLRSILGRFTLTPDLLTIGFGVESLTQDQVVITPNAEFDDHGTIFTNGEREETLIKQILIDRLRCLRDTV